MTVIKGVLSFPSIFSPKIAKGSEEAKYSAVILIPPNDKQLPSIIADIERAKIASFPNGYTGSDICLSLYEVKYLGKEYYDPRFDGWHVISCSANSSQKPAVVDLDRKPIIDPSTVFSGMVVHVAVTIGGYTKGRGGVGAWLNGVLVTNETPPMGNLGRVQSVEQMFINVPLESDTIDLPLPVPNPQKAKEPRYKMTEKAQGFTYEQYKANPDWTDELLISSGKMIVISEGE
jgi:hypothetical protein